MGSIGKSLALFLIIIMAITSLIAVYFMSFGLAQSGTNESGVITSDTTWTQAGSPYNLVGNISVSSDVTLTIGAGVTVNLNDFYMTIYGGLVAKGTSTNKIQINGISGTCPFMPPPAPNPYPFTYGINFTELSVGYNAQSGSGSIIENAIINSTTLALESSPQINNDIINGYITSNGTSVISNNLVTGEIDLTGPSTVSNNQINGTIQVQTNVAGGSTEDNSNPEGTPVISNNTVTGGGINGIGISFLTDTVTGLTTYSGNAVTVSGNTITGCNNAGIGAEGIGVIENNLITNNQDGIDIEGPNTVLNNTIENNYIGIQQVNNFDFPTVINNNIQNNSYNFFLYHSVTSSVNATYNYWGTTNKTAIGNSIYDNKDDSNLGTVNFVPFLAMPNSQAPSLNTPSPTPAVPEFPGQLQIITLIAFVAVLSAVIIVKKRRTGKIHCG
jgi:parallel beta-helix repeat protein